MGKRRPTVFMTRLVIWLRSPGTNAQARLRGELGFLLKTENSSVNNKIYQNADNKVFGRYTVLSQQTKLYFLQLIIVLTPISFCAVSKFSVVFLKMHSKSDFRNI